MRVTQWVEDIRNLSSPEAKILLIGNKIDLEEEREVSKEQGQELAEKLDLYYMETSAK